MLFYEDFLAETEEYVKGKFNDVIIISQVSIPQDRFELILTKFKEIFEQHWLNERKNIKYLWEVSPKTCLYLTVTYAIYYYDGNFWRNFKSAISLNNEHVWKRKFLDLLTNENLIVFDKSSPQKYVNNILGHASLPNHNIKNFISNVLVNAVEYNLEPEEIVSAFNKHNISGNVKTYGIYKSVQDFIKLNNHVSNDVLSRCIEVWREHNTPFFENYRDFLPDHILQEFDNYEKENESGNKVKASFIKRPQLMYSPENQKIFVHLPLQRFPLQKYQSFKWVIKSEDKVVTLRTIRSISSETNEVEFAVDIKNHEYEVEPNADYEIALFADGKLKGEWQFCLPTVIFFHGKTFYHERKDHIAIKDLVAIVHKNVLSVIEKGKNRIFIKPIFDLWSDYYEVEIDIKDSDTLRFPQQTVYLNPDRMKFEMIGNCCENIKSDALLFSTIPEVMINKQGIETDYRKWTLRLTHNWTNNSISILVNELIGYNSISTDQFILKIDTLLAKIGAFFGRFTISLTGILGQDYKMEFILLRNQDFDLAIHKSIGEANTISIETTKNLNFASESDVYIQKNYENSWEINKVSPSTRIKGTIFNRDNFEPINVTIFSSDIIAEIKNNHNEIFKLGETFNNASFKWTENYLLLDLENPKLINHCGIIKVRLYEQLRSGERAQKEIELKTGRRHKVGLDYFDGINDTYRTRTIFFEVPECSIHERLFTIETYWKVNQITHHHLVGNTSIKWDVSFPPEALEIRLWLLNKFDYPFFQKYVPGTCNECRVEGIPQGYYLIELSEHHQNDFFSSLFNNSFPIEWSDKIKIFNNINQPINHYTFTKWLLLEDIYGEEYERNYKELEDILVMLYKNQNLMLDMLLQDYDSCCDFGIQNISELLKIVGNYSTDSEFQQFLLKLIGFQEWDLASFQKIISPFRKITNQLSEFVPLNLRKIYSKSPRELFLLNQRKIFKEQLIEGFSIEHAFIAHLRDVYIHNEYRERVETFGKLEITKISQIRDKLFQKRIIPLEFSRILDERIIPNTGDVKNFPYLIGVTACFTAALLYVESQLSEEERISIRNFGLWMLQHMQKWFLHDLIYWKCKFIEYEDYQKNAKERKRQYEHPSFKWKS